MYSIIIKLLRKFHLSKYMYHIDSQLIMLLKGGARKINNSQEALKYLTGLQERPVNSCIVNRELPEIDCDIEIIVPCYNVEKYVEECVDSILSQKTRYSIHVTIINDGSTDRTREVLKKYEGIQNVKIIDQRNMGHSGARNAGIASAHGKYLMFVDSDDVLCQGTLEALMNMAEKTDADVVDSGHIRFADSAQKGFRRKIVAKLYDSMQKPQVLPYNEKALGMTGFPCGKIFRSTLFKGIEFPQGYWFEDTIVGMIIVPMCSRIATLDIISFRYRMNPDSISHQFTKSLKTLDTLYITLQLLKDRETLGVTIDQKFYDFMLRQLQHNFVRVSHFTEKVKQAVFIIQRDLLLERFADYSTANPRLKPIEKYLRADDYVGFRLWCKWY